MLSGLKLEMVEPLLIKGKPKEEDFAKLDAMAETIYEKHKSVNLV